MTLPAGTVVHITTTNGGDAVKVLAQSWAGLSYPMLVEAPGLPFDVLWIEGERIATAEVVS